MPSIKALESLTPQQMDDSAANALEQGQPIPEWRDRATTKTGTGLGEWNGMDIEAPES